jgi:IS5 family transposase
MEQRTFFGENDKLKKLSKLGDPLEIINKYTNWDIFAQELKNLFYKDDKGLGGRPAYEYILLFKILILQQQHNLSDDKVEYMINDRISFQRFLGLSIDSTVPDATTIWLFREKLSKNGYDKKLFILFKEELDKQGFILQEGSIVDSTIVQKPCKHKDSYDDGAKWTRKGTQTYYGYKDHIKVDSDSKLITKYKVTSANVFDNQEIANLSDSKDKELYADKGYTGKNIEEQILKKNPFIKIQILKKGTKAHKLTEAEEKENTVKNMIRVRVEHVFGHIKQAMGGFYVRSTTFARAATQITLKNLTYNLNRAVFLLRANRVSIV